MTSYVQLVMNVMVFPCCYAVCCSLGRRGSADAIVVVACVARVAHVVAAHVAHVVAAHVAHVVVVLFAHASSVLIGVGCAPCVVELLRF